MNSDFVLGFFSEDLDQALRLYRQFMGQEGISKKELEKTFDQRILGDNDFAERVLEREREKILPGKRRHEFGLEEIASRILETLKISPDELKGKGRSPGTKRARRVFCLIARDYGYKGGEIGKFLRRDPASITKYSYHREDVGELLQRVVSALEEKP